jgi:glycerophosphoryl diester phosphodiesterase
VFGRDPDACLDLIELEIKAKRREVLEWCLFEKALRHFADENGLDLGKVEAGTTSARNLDAFVLASQAAFPSKGVEIADMAFQTRQRAPTLSGWRLEATLREFATPAPLHIWFDWPIHPIDDTGILQDAKAEGEEPPWMADQEARDEARRKKAAEAGQAITEAVEVLGGPGKPACSVQGVADHLGCDVDTVRNRLKKHPMYGFKRGMIVAREQDEDSDEG